MSAHQTPSHSASAPVIDGIDTTGWSSEWRGRLLRADPGLTVPGDTPRAESERKFLRLWDDTAWGVHTFRSLCTAVGEPPNDSWGSVERWVKDLLMDLKRVGSLEYDPQLRRWTRTERGAAACKVVRDGF